MYRHKAVYISLTVLILFVQLAPALAAPTPSQLPATQNIEEIIAAQNQNSSVEATTTPELEQALAEAEMAVRQIQAERIKQELDILGEELEGLNTDYFAETTKLEAIEKSLNDAREKLRWFEAELEAQHQILNNRVAEIYKHGEVEPLQALIDKANFKDILTRIGFLLKISEQDAKLLQSIDEQRLKVETTKDSLDQLYEQQKEITMQLEGRKKTIEAKIKQEQDLLASVDDQTKAIIIQQEEERQRKQVDVVNELLTKPKADKVALAPGTIGFEAIKYLGVPYVWGGENPAIGLDCSGLVKLVYKKFGIDLPHYSRSQAQLGVAVKLDELQSGDLVFFGSPIHHVGIYLGEGYYIHAPKRNDVVKISRMSDRRDYACARRIISTIPAVQ